jgi:elongation factor Ts
MAEDRTLPGEDRNRRSSGYRCEQPGPQLPLLRAERRPTRPASVLTSLSGRREDTKSRKRETKTVSEKIDAKLVKELREKSGAPMGDCLKALQETKGNIEDAFVVLRKRGMASAQKKAARSTNEGAVGTYIHAGGKIGVLLELNCESDFVARTEDFQELLKDIAMHIAASDPHYVRTEDVTQADLDREKDIFRAQATATGKPAPVIEKIVEGKMAKFYEEVCLLEQPFIKDQTVSIKELIGQKVGKLGENITVRRFARFKVGALDWTVATTKPVEAAAE